MKDFKFKISEYSMVKLVILVNLTADCLLLYCFWQNTLLFHFPAKKQRKIGFAIFRNMRKHISKKNSRNFLKGIVVEKEDRNAPVSTGGLFWHPTTTASAKRLRKWKDSVPTKPPMRFSGQFSSRSEYWKFGAKQWTLFSQKTLLVATLTTQV